ncbi:MAG TPA: hypothetical protein VN512_05035 [Clostridia bacterium]|nr:hypothetical protein [Clostridia bacterium]
MFQARWSFGRENFERVREMRRFCFVQEQGIAQSEEFDAFDGISAHLFVEDEAGTPIASGRIFPDRDITRIGRITTMPDFRNERYDDLVLRLLLYKAEGLAGKSIVTCPRESEAAFYEPFGFKRDGASFFGRNAMRVRLSVPRDGILWHSDCK